MPYTAIRSEGGLFPLDTLERLAREELPGQKAADFGLPKGRRLGDEIALAWSEAQGHWNNFRRRAADLAKEETGATLTRERWIVRLLNDSLGYELTYQPAAAVVEGRSYPISHRAGVGEDAPPVHTEGFRVDLDHRPPAGHRRLSPQALVQEYLNRSEKHPWGIVTNGLRLRLLRDTSRTARPTYLEFELQGILDGNLFTEFALFYRLCHRTRLPRTGEDPARCLLETYFREAVEQGGRVRDRLRDGVEEALKMLGTGFLRHPANHALREKLGSGQLPPAEYHRQLLRLVYRLLFLMVAEERHMIVPEGPQADRRQRIYDTCYSVRRLRERADQIFEESPYHDLWQGLQKTFALLSDGSGSNPLGIPPLNGDLFSPRAMPDLEGTHLHNHHLLKAVRRMSLFEEKGIQQRVNYGALDVEELGSVYESLLDYQPGFEEEQQGPAFLLRAGTERKSTGSYYTRPELVRELIQSALAPVLEERLQKAKSREEQEQAILSVKVCDPASGSGHFLLAAARRLGRELARVRTGEEEPTPERFREAVRDVIGHCVYGVDVNPLAVDLCKLALWLEGHSGGKPLSFLDHHIKSGNSLIGVLDPEVLKEGIPDKAFNPVTGDGKEAAAGLKKRNRAERKGQRTLRFEKAVLEKLGSYVEQSRELLGLAENTPADVTRKAELFRKTRESRDWYHDWSAANLWTAAFFVPLTDPDDPLVPTHERFMDFLERGHADGRLIGNANGLAGSRRFFHWFLEFPEVFATGGFDVLLGNPPWEMLQPEEIKFFAGKDETIESMSGVRRKKAIGQLDDSNRELAAEWKTHKRGIEGVVKFVRGAGRFAFSATGKINTYGLFAELARRLLNENGRAGIIVPTGIATDDTYKQFFADLNARGALVNLYDFENREAIFLGVHRSYKFSLLTLSAKPVAHSEFAFFCTRTEHLRDPRRRFQLSPEDLALLNPNTRTCPVFRTQADAQLTKKIYRRAPVLVNERTEENPWGVEFRQGLFNMTSDSGLFQTMAGEGLLPLYEAKMFHQFDHRWATWENGEAKDCLREEKCNSNFRVCPRYWVPQEGVGARLGNWKRGWLLSFRDVTNATNERTAILAVLPRVGVGHTAPIAFLAQEQAAERIACFFGSANSLIFDYIARQKIGGTHLTFSLLNQLPFLPPATYDQPNVDFIAARVLELVYTAWDLKPFAKDLGYHDEPFPWDEDRRALLRAELDAYYAHLYGLTRDELRYILDPKEVYGEDFPGETFRVLKENEMKKYGEYRTRRLVLEAYDRLAQTERFKQALCQPASRTE